jgi:hypothetical protein
MVSSCATCVRTFAQNPHKLAQKRRRSIEEFLTNSNGQEVVRKLWTTVSGFESLPPSHNSFKNNNLRTRSFRFESLPLGNYLLLGVQLSIVALSRLQHFSTFRVD